MGEARGTAIALGITAHHVDEPVPRADNEP